MKATAHKRGRDPRWPYVPTISHITTNLHGYRLPFWFERVGNPRATHVEAVAFTEEFCHKKLEKLAAAYQARRERLAANEQAMTAVKEEEQRLVLEHERLCAEVDAAAASLECESG